MNEAPNTRPTSAPCAAERAAYKQRNIGTRETQARGPRSCGGNATAVSAPDSAVTIRGSSRERRRLGAVIGPLDSDTQSVRRRAGARSTCL